MIDDKKEVLIVEDDPTLLHSLLDAFAEEFDVRSAGNGEEALKSIEEKMPDIVLLDIILPKMDGITVLKKIRENPTYAALPVMMLTNKEDMETVGESVAEGVQDFLVKHEWKLSDIIKRVKERLGMTE